MNLFQKIKIVFTFPKEKVTDELVVKIVTEGAELAVKSAKAFHFMLDYSDASIKTVDKVLKKVKVHYANQEKELSNYGLIFGLYCIAVLVTVILCCIVVNILHLCRFIRPLQLQRWIMKI